MRITFMEVGESPPSDKTAVVLVSTFPLPRPHPTPLSLFPSRSRPDRPPPALRMMMKVMGAPQSEVPERGVRPPRLFNRDGYF